MNEIASPGQLRLAYLRWALLSVPAIVFLGFLSGRIANSGYGNRWFDALEKPAFMPPGWAFGAAWTVLYVLMGLALAMIIHARGSRGRGAAILLFLVQLVMNLLWSPLFFRAHQVDNAFILILLLIVTVAITAFLFWRIRAAAGLLLLPYLAWLVFAAALNYEIGRLNPDAETLVAPALKAQI
ncbi:TspO and MBR like proteins [Sphingobium quisquiliarum P25]|uniref:TspO and MBR like proteins n=1 Tax=Sphingobium quisquiliarum P25 TaxID=1329909 RepID=T0IBH9_9SPHN|nr:tryptophan-rich sensory protein [Sphingobium quisquiliarum]EQB09055.1 TspO and MBR like proteins [Sphingobium quisquiliarum P25]